MHLSSVFLFLFLIIGTSVHAAEKMPTPEEAFQRLKEGNQRFVAGKTNCSKNLLKELQESKIKQTPYAAILCCSDSRIPPELVFDESLGKLFIIRVAGNVATDITIGSIEYAVEALKVPLLVVLGHEQCGVLIAALNGSQNLPAFVYDLINEVSIPVAEVKKEEPKDFDNELHMCVVKNVEWQMREIISKSDTVKKAIEKKQTMLQGAIFHFNDREIEWCPCNN